MGKDKRISKSISEKLDIPRDVIMELPKISITADDEILIENHMGIQYFGDKEIKIKTKVGVLSIEGKNFEVLYLGGNTVVIGGKFKLVRYLDYEELDK